MQSVIGAVMAGKGEKVKKPIAVNPKDSAFRVMEDKIKELTKEISKIQFTYKMLTGHCFEISDDDADDDVSVSSHHSRQSIHHLSHQMANVFNTSGQSSMATSPSFPALFYSPEQQNIAMLAAQQLAAQFAQQQQQQQQMQQMQQYHQIQQMQQYQQQFQQQQQQQQQEESAFSAPSPSAQAAPFVPSEAAAAAGDEEEEEEAAAPSAAASAASASAAASAAAAAASASASASAAAAAAAPSAAAAASAAPSAAPSASASAAAEAAAASAAPSASASAAPAAVAAAASASAAASAAAAAPSASAAVAAAAATFAEKLETARQQVASCRAVKKYLDKIHYFILQRNQWFCVGDLGQKVNGLARPKEIAALEPPLKLSLMLMSDQLFKVIGKRVGLAEYPCEGQRCEGCDECEAEADEGGEGEGSERVEYFGTVYVVNQDVGFAYIKFPVMDDKHEELFKGQCDWLAEQKKAKKKREDVWAFEMVDGVKFGRNLIAFRDESNDIFSSLKVGDEIVYYVREEIIKGVKSFFAHDIAFASASAEQ